MAHAARSSAFAAGLAVVLRQKATEEMSSEITATAIPELLKTLALHGTIVTIDVKRTQTKIAKTLRTGEDLLDSILFAGLSPEGARQPCPTDEVTAKKTNHGRREVRRGWAYEAVDRPYKHGQWKDISRFALIKRERTEDGRKCWDL